MLPPVTVVNAVVGMKFRQPVKVAPSTRTEGIVIVLIGVDPVIWVRPAVGVIVAAAVICVPTRIPTVWKLAFPTLSRKLAA